MAGRPRTRAKKAAQEQAKKNGKPILTASGRLEPKHKYLADIYAEKYTTFNALRNAMIQNGIVEHRINPYDVIQRAIDDTATDYLLIRRAIEKDSHGDPEQLTDHPLFPYMERMREAMVRYSTFAMQYDIQKRQLKLSESRIAMLAVVLKTVLHNLGLNQEQIQAAPGMLIEAVMDAQPKENTHLRTTGQSQFDPHKASALAEILHNDAAIEIIDADEDNQ